MQQPHQELSPSASSIPTTHVGHHHHHHRRVPKQQLSSDEVSQVDHVLGELRSLQERMARMEHKQKDTDQRQMVMNNLMESVFDAIQSFQLSSVG